jgi:hypothetical protein
MPHPLDNIDLALQICFGILGFITAVADLDSKTSFAALVYYYCLRDGPPQMTPQCHVMPLPRVGIT